MNDITLCKSIDDIINVLLSSPCTFEFIIAYQNGYHGQGIGITVSNYYLEFLTGDGGLNSCQLINLHSGAKESWLLLLNKDFNRIIALFENKTGIPIHKLSNGRLDYKEEFVIDMNWS